MTTLHVQFEVTATEAGKRLDQAITSLVGVSRSVATRLIAAGALVDGSPKLAKFTVNLGQTISVPQLAETALELIPAIGVETVYEDEAVVVVNKPAGLIVHPAGRNEPSLAGFARGISSDPDTLRPGIVHRLDRGTSGLVIIARTEAAKKQLQAAFATRDVQKTYIALVNGRPAEAEAVLDWPIGRHPTRPTLRMVRTDGKPSRTIYRVTEHYDQHSLLEVKPETGRTHQIRVHTAKLGHPVVGDTVYGAGQPTLGLDRLFLHAARLQFNSPTGKAVDVSLPLPSELESVLESLRVDHV